MLRKCQEGRKPETATDLQAGKPLKAHESHGRYRGDSPEGTNEEYVAEAVRIGTSGTEVGVGKPTFCGLAVLMRRRDRKTKRGVPRRMVPQGTAIDGTGSETGRRCSGNPKRDAHAVV